MVNMKLAEQHRLQILNFRARPLKIERCTRTKIHQHGSAAVFPHQIAH